MFGRYFELLTLELDPAIKSEDFIRNIDIIKNKVSLKAVWIIYTTPDCFSIVIWDEI